MSPYATIRELLVRIQTIRYKQNSPRTTERAVPNRHNTRQFTQYKNSRPKRR